MREFGSSCVTISENTPDRRRRRSARFQAANLVPDQTETRCIAVTAKASVPGTVKGYAVNQVYSPQGLEDHILISIRTGLGGGFSSCNGFAPDGTLVSNAPLSTMAQADDYTSGLGGWEVSPGTQTRTYEITWKFDTSGLTQSQLDQLQGAQTGIDIAVRPPGLHADRRPHRLRQRDRRRSPHSGLPEPAEQRRRHHVVVTARPHGSQQDASLYVDGADVASGTINHSSSFSGWWRAGYGALPTTSGYPTNATFAGAIDELAIYPSGLTAARIAAHYAAR
jgi:hypothetical protein